MIRFSAALVVVAIGFLLAGVITSGLLLVYLAIGISVVALIVLGAGVARNRAELFGQQPSVQQPQPYQAVGPAAMPTAPSAMPTAMADAGWRPAAAEQAATAGQQAAAGGPFPYRFPVSTDPAPSRQPEFTPTRAEPVPSWSVSLPTRTDIKAADIPDIPDMQTRMDIKVPPRTVPPKAPPRVDIGKPEPAATAADDVTEALTPPAPPAGGNPAAQEASGADTDAGADADARPVIVVPGVPRYHAAGCILIRFMSEEELERMPLAKAQEAGCTPCRACQSA